MSYPQEREGRISGNVSRLRVALLGAVPEPIAVGPWSAFDLPAGWVVDHNPVERGAFRASMGASNANYPRWWSR